MLRKYFIQFILMFSLPIMAFPQGEIDIQSFMAYYNERSTAIYLNSNGIGAGFRYGQRITARSQHIYEVDFLSIRHPKEIRISNSIDNTRSFIFGKENAFFELRALYGRQSELFRKNDRGGISIRHFYSVGPALGILKPVYYEILYITSITPVEFNIKTERYSDTTHLSNIYGRASFFKGIKELSLVPGATIKGGFSFEYSRQDMSLHALEAGMSIDIFPKRIPIMATSNNNFMFFNLFVSYRFGKYIDISEAARALTDREREERRQRRRILRDQRQQDREDFSY